MNKRKNRNIYRHPVTNKFISKQEWETFQNEREVEGEGEELKVSDFDEKYIKESEEFMRNIETSFNDEKDNLVQTIPHKEVPLNKPVWKILFHRIAFWL